MRYIEILAVIFALSACNNGNGGATIDTPQQGGNNSASGGGTAKASGGTSTLGGSSTVTGQGGTVASGGTTSSTTTSSTAIGGSASGGTSVTAGGSSGSASGGKSTSSGGTAVAVGGSSGNASGGKSTSSGGTSVALGGSSGSASGGQSAGGSTASGGVSTGGSSTTATGGAAGSSTTTGTQDWVGTWASAQQLVESSSSQDNRPLSPGLANNTLRQVIHVSIGGKKLRMHFSNAQGNAAMTITKAHLAVSTGLDKIDTATDKELLFGGKASVTIAANKEVASDSLDFDLAPLSNLAISIQFGSTPTDTNLTGHPGSRCSYFLKAGDAVSAANLSGAATAKHWYVISELDVMADADSHAVAILGDSITDGRGSTDDGNDRWPDALAKLLQANAATKKVGVLNQGVGGGAVISGGLGIAAKLRFDHDILQPAGVKWAIVFEGVNDINGGATSDALINAYKEFITKAHAANIKIYGATITPFGKNTDYGSKPQNETTRTAVNTWIRSATSGYDGVVDMDAAVRDPAAPANLLDAYSSDGLHSNPTGYAKMGAAVSLTFFQ